MNETKGYENLYGVPVTEIHDWFRGYAKQLLEGLDGKDPMDLYKEEGLEMFKDLIMAFNLEESGDAAGIEMLRDACKSGEDRMRKLITQ